MEVLDGSSWRSAACLLADMGQRAMERNEVCLTSALNALKDPMQWPRAVEQVKMVVQQQFVACQALCGRWQYGLQLMPSEPLVGPPRCQAAEEQVAAQHVEAEPLAASHARRSSAEHAALQCGS